MLGEGRARWKKEKGMEGEGERKRGRTRLPKATVVR
jgi:hypothetical protein